MASAAATVLAILLGAKKATATLDACTALAIDAAAMKDGVTVVTHTSDCANCDFRLGRVDPEDLEDPVVVRRYRPNYPTEVSNRSASWRASSLEYAAIDLDLVAPPFENGALAAAQERAWAGADWQATYTLGFLELDELKTLGKGAAAYGSVESQYGIANDAGLAMGESTCEAKLGGALPRACPTCDGPLVDITQLTRLALRACATARCAIRFMGALAEKHGYYAAELVPGEAGEALTIGDGRESWMFHILPDKKGTSAVWAAGKVPRGHVAPVANAFVLRGIPEEAYAESDDRTACLWEEAPYAATDDACTYLASTNLETEAVEAGLLEKDDRGLLDFAKTYGTDPKTAQPNAMFLYSTRRQWRVMSLVAPAATAAFVDAAGGVPDVLGSELPWSVKAEKALSVHDILAINRDYYEGSAVDLTKGFAAGPWGDPNRFDGAFDGQPNAAPEAWDELPSRDELMHQGRYERAISMFRTSYSTCVVSSPGRALVWFAQGAPHAGVYVPTFAAGAIDARSPLARGSLFQRTADSLFWSTTLVANWLRANTFKFSIRDVRDAQKHLEQRFAADAAAVPKGGEGAFNAKTAATALASWNRLFDKLAAKYRDGYRVSSGKIDEIDVMKYFYPNAWLKLVGFYSPRVNYYDSEAAAPARPDDAPADAPGAEPATAVVDLTWLAAPVALVALALSAYAGVVVGRKIEKKSVAPSDHVPYGRV